MPVSQITDYTTLQPAVLELLSHKDDADLSAALPLLIQLAERRLRNDWRVRAMTCVGSFTIRSDGETMPDDYGELDQWYHDGPTYFGPIGIVGAHELSQVKARFGTTGVPRYAAISGGRAFFAPAPEDGAAYATRLSYRQIIKPLSASSTVNWLITSHPHIYATAAIIECLKWLKDDDRIPLFEAQLGGMLDDLYVATERKESSGQVHGRIGRPIGGR